MSRDLVIRWPHGPTVPLHEQSRLPSNVALGTLCRDYTRGLAVSVRWRKGRWWIRLPGETRTALYRLAEKPRPLDADKRLIEVMSFGEGPVMAPGFAVYVTTRCADEVTNAVADGLAALIAQHWRGEREST